MLKQILFLQEYFTNSCGRVFMLMSGCVIQRNASYRVCWLGLLYVDGLVSLTHLLSSEAGHMSWFVLLQAMFFQGKWLLLESWNFKTYCRFPIGSLLKKAYLYWLKILRQTLLKFVDSSPLFDIWLPRLDLLLAYPSQHQFGNHLDFIQRPDPPNRLQHRERSMKTVTYTHPEWWLDQKKLPTYLHIPSHRPTYLP